MYESVILSNIIIFFKVEKTSKYFGKVSLVYINVIFQKSSYFSEIENGVHVIIQTLNDVRLLAFEFFL